MAEIINMPRLSDTMEEGVVAKWLVNIGDKVNEGDILAEIETDKATMEFESFHEGTLLHIGIQEGETAEVDTLLAIIGEEGEDISQLLVPVNNSVQLDLVDQINETESSIEEDKPEINSEIKINNSFQIITMPRLSDTMEEGTVSSWLVNVGDTGQEGDILAEIETDKATMEFESFHEGTLLYIGIKVGETAKVDSLLAVIGDADSDFKSAVENFGSEIPQVKNENTESINYLTPETPETPDLFNNSHRILICRPPSQLPVAAVKSPEGCVQCPDGIPCGTHVLTRLTHGEKMIYFTKFVALNENWEKFGRGTIE